MAFGIDDAIFGGIYLLGSAIGLIGQSDEAAAKEEAAQRNAQIKREQANELLSREAINEKLMREQGNEAYHLYAGSRAYGNAEGAGLSGMLKIRETTARNISLARRDAEWKAKMLQEGADVDTKLSGDISTANTWTMLGGGLQVGSSLYKLYRGPTESSTVFSGGSDGILPSNSPANYMTKG